MKKEPISIAFTGDIAFDLYMDKKWEDENLVSEDILDFLNSADHVVANVEGPVISVEREDVPSNSILNLLHSINPEATCVLKKIGADIWNLNNNHMMDAGPEGLYATLREAEKSCAATIGAGMNIDEASTPLIIDAAGGIGMFSVGYRRGCKPADENKAGCFLWNDLENIEKRISEIKANCRWCIMVIHGGEEFTSLPSPYTRERYLNFLNMGADIIVCHHPHVPMNYETVGDKIIFYSLGNFIFDTDYQRSQYNTEKGLLIKLNLTEDSFSFEPLGIIIDRNDEKVLKGEIPKIFKDVQSDEYNKLAPLAAKMFVAATKRQQIYLNPEEYKNASDEKWHEHFFNPKRSGRVPGEALDFQIICPLADKAEEGAWKESRLTDVVEYILEQL